ncbi:MAG: alpha/beta hydrolase [Candidatus Protistobacter heckmanni]|nr:alpha/beta hydrolase [Candidatus Protistobacter heckmanni]
MNRAQPLLPRRPDRPPRGPALPAAPPPPASLYLDAKPLNLTLDDWPHPYPVKGFSVNIMGQPFNMAYMDVQPQPDKGAVVLMHGKNFAGDYWGGVASALSAQGYRVIISDQIGFGRSSKPETPYNFHDLAAYTRALLDSLKIGRFHLVANSMGGMLAVCYTRLYPQRVRSLTLKNLLGLEDYVLYIPPQENETLLKLEMAQTEASYRNFMHSYFPNWKPAFERNVELYARVQKGPTTGAGRWPRC